jgi:hypothetical protein
MARFSSIRNPQSAIRNPLTRREWLKLTAAGVVGFSVSGWLESLAADAAGNPQRRRSCILLWMNGGPSQMDTWDLKPGHENGGTFKAMDTAVPGIQISEHLPKLGEQMKHMAIIRSMSTKEADHGRATFLMRTGAVPVGPVQYPPLGSLITRELEKPEDEIPGFVSIAPYRFFSPGSFTPGYLGPRYAPLIVGDTGLAINPQGQTNYEQSLKVQDLDVAAGVSEKQALSRVDLLGDLEKDFLAERPGVSSLSHRTAYERAVRMMRSQAVKAFDLSDEPAALRDAYGRNLFGQGCLLARRLVERGVPFIEVTLGGVQNNNALGWDTHQDNFENVKRLSQVLDPAFATLMTDLKSKGLLDSTLIVWMGEFGRTPKIAKERTGRDHFATAWSTVLAGGGIKGGQVVGKTSDDGMEVKDRPVSVNDLFATVCLALGIDYNKKNMSNVGRPIKIVDKNPQPIKEILA